MVIIDTNIIIDYLRQPAKVDTDFEKILSKTSKSELSISIISVQELFAGRSSKKDEETIMTLILPLKIFPYSFEVAKKAGEIIRNNKNMLSFADAAIAGTALINNAQLLTLNKKDFQGIEGLTVL